MVVCVGGGLGVAYVGGEEAPTITQWGNVLLDACQALGVRSNVSVEPGRSIVAQAAITVYEVGPRDGLQNEARQVPTADKLRFIDALVGAGYGSAGERCMAISVAVLVGDVGERLIPKLLERTKTLKVDRKSVV